MMNYHQENRYSLLAHSNSLKRTSVKTTKVLFAKIYLKRTFFLIIFAFFICVCTIYQTSLSILPKFRLFFPEVPYLINTSTCQIKDWPLFDKDIWPLYQNLKNADFGCDKNAPILTIERVNFTWIHIIYPKNGGWLCNATELARKNSTDGLTLGPTVTNLQVYTNFDRDQMANKLENGSQFRWDSLKVNCESSDKTKEYSRVVPLIQHYKAKKVNANLKVNIMLLGIDSISRLNFLRHMHQTKSFFDANGFIPLLGHHKVGENSFPNILPMLTGHLSTYYYNDTESSKSSKFSNVRMIFKDAQEKGYLTTFIEDMPPYGLFTVRGGLAEQPTDYYLRPTNLAIWDQLYYTYSCYQDRLEHELYWDYLLDLFEAFSRRSKQAHLTLAHMSTLTHNYFNHAGYADKPFASFLRRLFTGGHHLNSVIMVYSDHALRFGDPANTTSSVHEQRLPFFYLYVPDSLTLNGLKADQLRAIVRTNQHRLTSHLDMHATMMHILTNTSTQKDEDDLPGRSFFTPIPSNRTCASAGIPPQYCLCNGYEPVVALTKEMQVQSSKVVLHINQLMAAHGNFCVPLEPGAIYRAFDSGLHSLTNRTDAHRYRLLHFATHPNGAIFEAILRLNSTSKQIINIENISRLTLYGAESNCVADKLDIVQFCLCWDKIK